MADYSYNEIMKMQNDAIRRVNEMQKKAKIVMNKENDLNEAENQSVSTLNQEKSKDNYADSVKRIKMPNDYLNDLKRFASTSSYYDDESKKISQNEKPQMISSNYNNNSFEDKIKNLLGDFSLDSDKALILSLVMLLTEEKADEMLILALLYLLT